ncbi:hypothetical protein ONZ45_g11969 [Pleurotus djamor]|nr:hypothetical protein ONZ45_g11969 [Pleurotus djamor]
MHPAQTLFTQADIEAQTAIDEEISKYRALIRELCVRRNAHNAISKLPDEILSRILFEYKALADTELRMNPTRSTWAIKTTSEASRDYLDSLLNVMRVCSLWRQVALDTATLWSTLPLDRSAWVAETFQRSKQSPLTLIGPIGRLSLRKSPNDILSAVMDAAPRFQDVDITLCVVNVHSMIPACFFPQSAEQIRPEVPLLRTCKIAYDTSVATGGVYIDFDYKPRLFRFPWIQLTSLQSLNLRNLSPVAVPPMPSLTHLVLEIDHYIDSHSLRVPQIIDILRNAPMLENITISRVSTDEASIITSPDPNTPLIQLPYLRELDMTSIYLHESVLFAYLDTPALQKTKIVFNNDNNDPGIQPNGDISHIQHLVTRSIPSDVEGLRVSVDMPGCTASDAGYDDNNVYWLTVNGEKDCEPPIFNLKIAALPLSTQCINIFQSLPLAHITDLTFKRTEGYGTWSCIIPQLVRLKHIAVDKSPTLSILGTAPELSSHGGMSINTNQTLTDVHNPELETITMDRMPISTLAEDSDTLKSICRFRHERQKPLHCLILGCCNLYEWREGFKEEVASYGTKVKWSLDPEY